MVKKTVVVDIDSMIQGVIKDVAARCYARAISPRLFPSTLGDEFLKLGKDEFIALDQFCRSCRLGHTLGGYMSGIEALALNNHPSSEDLPFLVDYLNKVIRAHKEGNLFAAEGWLNALYVGLKAANVFLPKAQAKLKQEDSLPRAHVAGGEGTKNKWAPQEEYLRKEVADYLAANSALIDKGANACWHYLKNNKRLCGYSPSMAIKKIQKVFNEIKEQREINK